MGIGNFFTTPVFIKQNTPKLRKALEELGYTNRNPNDFIGDSICTFPYPTLCHTNAEYMCFDFDDDFNEVISPSIGFVECSNMKMFIAIAAKRIDNDYRQWFTDGIDWKINMTDKWDNDDGYGYENNTDLVYEFDPATYHKATVEELIKHFKQYD